MGFSKRRLAGISAIAVLVSVVALAFGGIGSAKDRPSVAQYGYGKGKVVICWRGKTKEIGRPALASHLRKGGKVGRCIVIKVKKKHRGHEREHGKSESRGRGKGKQQSQTVTPGSGNLQPGQIIVNKQSSKHDDDDDDDDDDDRGGDRRRGGGERRGRG